MQYLEFLLYALMQFKQTEVTNAKLQIPPMHFSGELNDFLATIQNEINFETLLFLSALQDCKHARDNLSSYTIAPKLLLTEKRAVYMKSEYNKQIFAIACLTQLSNENVLLELLLNNLQHMRLTPLLLIFEGCNKAAQNLHSLRRILKFLEAAKMLNVIAVFNDFDETKTYYSYSNFPRFQVERHIYRRNAAVQIYPNRLQDLKGLPLRTLPDDLEPRTIVYIDAAGKLRITGYVWFVLQILARRLNATLTTPYKIKPGRIYYNDMLNYTRNDTLDIPASLAPQTTQLCEYSYPLYSNDWCVMLPLERELSRGEIMFYFNALFSINVIILQFAFSLLLSGGNYVLERKWRATQSEIFINGNLIRALLGQPFSYPTRTHFSLMLVITLLCVGGLIFTSIYSAFLQASLTSPPLQKKIESIDDLSRSALKVLVFAPEYSLIPDDVRERYSQVFNVSSDLNAMLEMRNSLNIASAYMVVNERWSLYHQQQQYFTRRLFRRSDICFMRPSFVNFMLHENSIYRDVLNVLINDVHAAGLMSYWGKSSFAFMLEAGKASYSDWAAAHRCTAAKMEEFYWIWMGYLLLIVLSMLCFILEMFLYRLRK